VIGPATLVLLVSVATGPTVPSAPIPAAVSKAARQTLPDWIGHPPSWVTWLSLFGGLGAFGWKLWEFSVERGDRTADKIAAIEGFWYQSIIVPRILQQILEFVDQQQPQYEAINGTAVGPGKPDLYKEFLDQFSAKLDHLRGQMRLLQVISVESYATLLERLDRLEDEIALQCYRHSSSRESKRSGADQNQRQSLFLDAQNDCIRELKELHSTLCAGKPSGD
jgi:hypothetical protein